MSVDLNRLIELVEAFPRQRIVLLGDLVADEFVYCDISRVSREAPVLILRHRETRLLPGGGANAANNLADLGARVQPVGAVGDDARGDALLECFRQKNMDVSGIVRVRRWSTPAKIRFLAGWTHTTSQQVLRVDEEPREPLPAAVGTALLGKARRRVPGASAVLASDYGYGAVTPQRVKALRARLITLDSRYALLDYLGTGVTAATPNEPELEALYHTRIGQHFSRLCALAEQTRRRLKLQALLVTRGRDGMVVCEPRRKPQPIPIFGSDEAVDVTGAGDTVIAVFTLALASGGTPLEAAHLANYAGGIVVMKRGTATVSREELLAAVRSELGGAARA